MSEEILVIAPHADDEVLGCGGTIAKHVSVGDKVSVGIVSKPAVDRYGDEQDPTTRRRNEANCAAKVLGEVELLFGEFREASLNTYEIPELVSFCQEIAPSATVIYIPHWCDLNQDHRRVSEVAQIAFRPNSSLRMVAAYSVDPYNWAERAFRPNLFVDVTETMELKLEALRQYEFECRLFPHPRSTEYVEAQAKTCGAAFGVKRAEAFEIVWSMA